MYDGKSRAQANTLCQLRTGINKLNSYLGKIGAADSEECSCKRGKETVDHFLFRCSKWNIVRATHKIRELAGNRWGDTGYLLGGWSGEGKDGILAKWKPRLEMVNATINFAIATGRLDYDRDKRNEETSEEEEEDSDE